MEHDVRVGQSIKCHKFRFARYRPVMPATAAPWLDKMRLTMVEATATHGSWKEQLEDGTHRNNDFSLDVKTDGRFGDLVFKVLYINLIMLPRWETWRPTVAEASSGERILFMQADEFFPDRITPKEIELLDGPPDERIEAIW